MRYALLFRAITRHPRHVAAFLAGAILPLVLAAMVLAPKTGGLSDTRTTALPPAFTIPTD